MTRVLDARLERPEAVLEEAAAVVFGGGTVIFPGDTSYAIACDPARGAAVDRVYVAKGRPDNAPLTLHVASPAEFLEYADANPLAALAAKRLLPGPVIVLIRKPVFVGDDVAAGLPTIAMRVPDDAFARELLERCGPLAGTTANPKAGPRYFGGDDRSMLPEADLTIVRGPTRYDRESTIVDLTGAQPRLVREGVVPASRLVELLGPLERPTVKVRTHTP